MRANPARSQCPRKMTSSPSSRKLRVSPLGSLRGSRPPLVSSSRHARLYPQNGAWIVEDLGSTNGTYLDRQKVTAPTPVPVGVAVRIGKTVLELRR